jgi:hypothetical protein
MTYLLSLTLKYSPSTALTVSGIVSSFRAFRSVSRALTISSDMLTMILFIAMLLATLPIDTNSNLYTFGCIYLLVAIGIWPRHRKLMNAEQREVK